MTETPNVPEQGSPDAPDLDPSRVSYPEDTTTNPNVGPDGTSDSEGVTDPPAAPVAQGEEGNTNTEGTR